MNIFTRTISESHFDAKVFNNSITENDDSLFNIGDWLYSSSNWKQKSIKPERIKSPPNNL